MADWQGKRPKDKRSSEHKLPDELKRDLGENTPPRRETWNRKPDRQKTGVGKRTDIWHTHSDVKVNWAKVFRRARIATAALLTLFLIAWFAWLIIRVSDKTHLTLVAPASVSKNWLSTTPYANSLKRQFKNLDSNNRYLATDNVSLEAAWESITDSKVARFGGPDGNLAVVYLCIVGIAADRNNDQRLEAYALSADASPFDKDVPDSTAETGSNRGDHPLYRFPISELIDNICEFQELRNNRNRVMLIIDSQKLELPTNLGLMHDRFAETVRKIYLEKMAGRTADIRDKHEFVLVLSHHPGQTNWPAPEFGSSIFGRFAQLAFSGSADGCLSGVPDGVVDLNEFQCYLISSVKAYASHKRNAKQVPMFLTSGLAESVVAVGANDVQAVNFPVTNAESDEQFDVGHANNLPVLAAKIDIDQSWTDFFNISDPVVERNPLVVARCAAVLARLEQLLLYGHESDELSDLQHEFRQIIGQLQNIEQEEFNFPPVSIAEARLISANSKNKLLPDNKETFLEDVWDVYQKFGPLDIPAVNEEGAVQQSNASDKSEVGSQSENVLAESAQSAENKTDARPSGIAADAATGEVVDVEAEKEKRIEPYKTLLHFASNEKPWLLPWIVWEGFATRSAGDSIAKKDLEYWLAKLGQDEARIDDDLTKGQIIEIKFLHLLNESVDWSVENQSQVQNCVHLAVRTRYLSEKFATDTDNRVLRWFENEFEDVDNQRRMAEDWLFANQFEMARTEFESAILKLQNLPRGAQEVTEAFRIRDEVARDAPHYAALIGRLLMRTQQTDSPFAANDDINEWQFVKDIGDMREKWVDMVIDNLALGRELTTPMIDPDLTVDSSSRSLNEIKKLVDKLESDDGFLKAAKEALINDTRKIKDNEGGLRIGTMMYIADLLRCPIIDDDEFHRETLRARFLEILPTGELASEFAGKPALQEFPDFDPEPSEEFKILVDPTSARLEMLPDNQQALAKLAVAGVWEDSLIRSGNGDAESSDISASDDIYPIVNVLDRIGKVSSREELPRLHHDLRSSDHLLRSVSSTIAEQLVPRRNKDDSTTWLLDGNKNTHKNRLLRVSSDLNQIDKSLAFEARVKRILGDCWGNNRIRDGADPYFAVLAKIAQKRIPDDYFPVITEWLNTAKILPLKQAVRDFRISAGRYQYREDGIKNDRQPHEFTIMSNATKIFPDGILAVQQQHQSSRTLVEPIPFELANDDGGPENRKQQRRFAIPLTDIEGGDSVLAPQYFFDEEMTFEKHDDLDLVLSFRGHLVAKKFEIDKIASDPLPDKVRVTGLRHDPEPLIQPVIRIDGDANAKTDVVFVLDCSASMKALFDLGVTEGENSETQMQRFDFLKLTLEETLVDMRNADAFNVGLVAIGNRAKYRQGSNEIVYSRTSRQFQREGVRPENDAYRLFDITDISDDSEFGELLGAISGLEPWGQTPLIDGIAEAHRMLQRRDSGNAKVIAVISDGVDEKTSKPSGRYPTDMLLAEYDQLEARIRADSIKFHFLGFDMTNSEVTKDQIERLGEADFQKQFNRIKMFAGENFRTPKDGAELKDSLRRINDGQITRFRVSLPNQKSELRDLNKPHDLKIEFDRPDSWNVSMTRSDELQKIWLEGNEFVKMQFRGKKLTFAPMDFENAEKFRLSGGMADTEIIRLPASRRNVRFAFQKIGRTEFSARPRRLLLEITTADDQPLFSIQDYKFISANAYWVPVAEFRIPDLPRGNYKLVLKFLPPGRLQIAEPVGVFALPFDNEVVLNGEKLRIQGTGEIDSASVMVEGASEDFDDPDLLRDVLIDYGQSPIDGRSITNRQPTNREFAENGKFVRHLFEISPENGDNSGNVTVYQASTLFDQSPGAGKISFDFTVGR